MVLRKKKKAAPKAKARKTTGTVGSMTKNQLGDLVKKSIKDAFGRRGPVMWPK
jgi:hypothetical protein